MAIQVDLETYPSSVTVATATAVHPLATEARVSKMNDALIANESGVVNDYGVHCNVGIGTGMQVIVGTGRIVLDGFIAEVPPSTPLTITAAHATLNRVDAVVAHLDRTSPGTISLLVKPGTAGSTTPPALQNDAVISEIYLGYVNVDGGVSSIVAGKTANKRMFVGVGQWLTYTPTVRVSDGSGGVSSTIGRTISGSPIYQYRRLPGGRVEFYIEAIVALTGSQGFCGIWFDAPIQPGLFWSAAAECMNDVARIQITDVGGFPSQIAAYPHGGYNAPAGSHVGQWNVDNFGRFIHIVGNYPYAPH